MKLLDFVKGLPSDWVLAPILRKGVAGSPGKQPLQESRQRQLGPDDAALIIERNKAISAVGLWTGPKGNGIVIVDCDMNDTAIRRKYGELAAAPRITSPRKNAAKYLFKVPKDAWREVAGFGHSKEHNEGFEVLWTGQGLIYGEYPGSEKHNVPEGHYEIETKDFVVPEAPAWLLAMMRAAKGKEGWIKSRGALRLTDRSPQLRQQMIFECLSVIPEQGPGSYEMWWRIGMAIHSELPDEVGFDMWKMWSQKDPHFDDDWESGKGMPHQKWASFKPDGKITFGTLSHIADAYDPERTRFSEESREAYEQERAKVVQEIRNSVLSHADTVAQAKEILELDNPSEINHRMNALAIAAGYRDRSAVEALLLSQLEYERKASATSWAELKNKAFQKSFLIPDVLPHPSVVLLYGAGGDGKSMTAWTLGKHIAMGTPFVVRGKLMPVKQGPVLLLNGDQSEQLIQEQLEEIDMPADAPVVIQQGWQLKRYNEFCKLIDKHKPAMVVIDSLIGCSSGDSFDENKSEFAAPLYWLSKNNGVLFPPTTIVIIHHANKTGGFRGTSAIRDAVDETWALKRPSGEINSLPANCRLINIEKSRSGRGGTSLKMQMEADLTFSVSDFMPEVDETKTTPDGIVDRVLMRIRTIYPRTVTRTELNADPLVGGRVAAITKSLQRLEKKGLIEVAMEEPKRGGGRPIKHYKAVLARGEGGGGCPVEQTPSAGTDQQLDNSEKSDDVSTCSDTTGQPGAKSDGCPVAPPLQEKGSAPTGQPDIYPRARSVDETNGTIDQTQWD